MVWHAFRNLSSGALNDDRSQQTDSEQIVAIPKEAY